MLNRVSRFERVFEQTVGSMPHVEGSDALAAYVFALRVLVDADVIHLHGDRPEGLKSIEIAVS